MNLEQLTADEKKWLDMQKSLASRSPGSLATDYIAYSLCVLIVMVDIYRAFYNFSYQYVYEGLFWASIGLFWFIRKTNSKKFVSIINKLDK